MDPSLALCAQAGWQTLSLGFLMSGIRLWSQGCLASGDCRRLDDAGASEMLSFTLARESLLLGAAVQVTSGVRTQFWMDAAVLRSGSGSSRLLMKSPLGGFVQGWRDELFLLLGVGV